jgi:alkylation response protein AidB-like acyl-CoA dehydrogenase
MDFRLDDTQRQLLAAAESMLARHAGPARARTVLYGQSGPVTAGDADLAAAIRSAGFGDAFASPDAGPLAVALVVEAIAMHAGCTPTIGPLLVAPALLGRTDLAGLMVLDAGRDCLVRYAAPGPAVVLDGDRARLVDVAQDAVRPAPIPYAFPMGRVAVPAGGEDLGPVAADIRNWCRVGLALELSGTMREALSRAVTYAQQRDQFGHPIGQFQAIQHRLAVAATMVEGARWLAYDAAWRRAEAGVAASAAGFASAAAARVLRDVHQVHGAIGFTVEADLHLWTMRLPVLRLEAGGIDEHRRAAGAAWLATALG